MPESTGLAAPKGLDLEGDETAAAANFVSTSASFLAVSTGFAAPNGFDLADEDYSLWKRGKKGRKKKGETFVNERLNKNGKKQLGSAN